MAKVKYNVKGVDTSGDFTPVKPGMYRAKIEEINDWSGQFGAGMEVVLSVTSDSKGKKKDVEGIGSKLWTYIYFDHEPSAFRLAEFIKALGLKETGTLDTDKMVGKEVQVRVKPDRNEEGDYRPRVGKLLALAEDAGEEPDEPEEGEEPEEDDEDDEGVDLDELSRAELKKFIKENELDITVKKSMSDDDVRAAITEATSEEDDDEEEPEDEEPEEEEDDDEGVDLDTLDRSALKKFIKDNELSVKVTKGMSDDDIRAAIAEAAESDDDEEDDDEEEGEEKDEAPDYNSWTQTKLKAELKERGLKLSGDFTKRKAVNALKKDDASDDEPF